MSEVPVLNLLFNTNKAWHYRNRESNKQTNSAFKKIIFTCVYLCVFTHMCAHLSIWVRKRNQIPWSSSPTLMEWSPPKPWTKIDFSSKLSLSVFFGHSDTKMTDTHTKTLQKPEFCCNLPWFLLMLFRTTGGCEAHGSARNWTLVLSKSSKDYWTLNHLSSPQPRTIQVTK